MRPEPQAENLTFRHLLARVLLQALANRHKNGVDGATLVAHNGGQTTVRCDDDVVLLVEFDKFLRGFEHIRMIFNLSRETRQSDCAESAEISLHTWFTAGTTVATSRICWSSWFRKLDTPMLFVRPSFCTSSNSFQTAFSRPV